MRISDWSSDVCSSDLKIDSSRHVPYKGQNIEIRQSIPFAKWMDGLKDRRARVRIADRLKRLAAGNAGDSKPVGDGVQELRFAFGPGYRISSAARRVGKEWVWKCRSRWWPDHSKKNRSKPYLQ